MHQRPKPDRLKMALIVLTAAALALSILTFFVVFFPSGSYYPVIVQQVGPGATTSFGNFPTSTPTSSLAISSGTATSSPAATTTSTPIALPAGAYGTDYSAPYPVSWNEGHELFSVTGAILQGDQLTLDLEVQMGNFPECVPLDIRFVADEAGTMKAPDSPAGGFSFPDTQSCDGTPNATYSEALTWTVNPSLPSFLFTTGGTSNVYFLAATTTSNGLSVSLPSRSG